MTPRRSEAYADSTLHPVAPFADDRMQTRGAAAARRAGFAADARILVVAVFDEPVIAIQPDDRAIVARVEVAALDADACRELRRELLAVAGAARHGQPVVLDVSRIEFAPSVAIGMLVGLLGELMIDNRRLILAGPDSRLQRVLSITRVDSLLQISPDLDRALSLLETVTSR